MNKKMIPLPMMMAMTSILLGCTNKGTMEALLYAPSQDLEASTRVSEKAESVYKNFANMVAPRFYEEFGKAGSSVCLSIPDLFLCYNMMAVLSETSLQEKYLEEIGASSLLELAAISKELIPVFCYVNNDGKRDSGAFNLNGLFFDPALPLLDNADACFKTIADSFNGYVFSSRPNTELVDEWIREADKEGYLSEVPTPQIQERTIVCTVSAYAIFDAFDDDEKERLEKIYREGTNRIEYSLSDGVKKMVDCLSLSSSNTEVWTSDKYVAGVGDIDTCSIRAYLPNEEVSLSELSASVFSGEGDIEVSTYDKVNLKIPMFDIDSSLEGHPSILAPSFSEGVGTGFFEKNPASEYDSYLAQNNKLTLDYKGFKGASITVIGAPESTEQPDEEKIYDLTVDRPFLFEINRMGLPLYYGQIVDPNYPEA